MSSSRSQDPEMLLATHRLYRRKPRSADLDAELAAHRELSSLMSFDAQQAIQRFLDLAVELCPAAGTAGLSELLSGGDAEYFEWTVMSGALADYVGGTTPRNFSPCGLCLDRHHTILVDRPARVFTYLLDANPQICEGLIVPLYDTGKQPFGTLWVSSHDPLARFDPTDARIIEQLAVQLVLAIKLRRKARMHVALEDAVRDREMLISEVRHRVKNMVQLASSLLRVQETSSPSIEVRQALGEARNRMLVLANVYDALLIPSHDPHAVEVGALIDQLVGALVSSAPAADRLSVEVQCDLVFLDATHATSLVLIVNEAVTNALKYAFDEGISGAIRVSMTSADGMNLLVISDNGCGLQRPPREGSLGMRLMRGLARQFDGQLSVDGSSGTTITLRWKPHLRQGCMERAEQTLSA